MPPNQQSTMMLAAVLAGPRDPDDVRDQVRRLWVAAKNLVITALRLAGVTNIAPRCATMPATRTARWPPTRSPDDFASALPAHLALIAALRISARRERTCPRAVKRARHNSYRVKKAGEPASIRRRTPATINLRGLPRTA